VPSGPDISSLEKEEKWIKMSRMKTFVLAQVDRVSKLIGVDLRYILRGGTYLAMTQISSAIFAFLLTIAYAHYLSKDGLGIYKFMLSTYSLFVIISLPGMDTSIVETIAKGNHGALKRSIAIKFKWGFLGTLAAWVYAIYLFYAGETVVGEIFLLVGVFLPFME